MNLRAFNKCAVKYGRPILKEKSFLYCLVSDNLPYKVLNGHSSRVTYLLYPHDKSVRFDPSWLLSGGQDSVVICWDIFTGDILHQFSLHSGPVTELLRFPANYRVSKSIVNDVSKTPSPHLCVFVPVCE